MYRKKQLTLVLAAVAAFSMWFYVDRVWAPPVEIHFSDLYPRWYGSRELLLRGRNPYGAAVSREIQVWAYGHALDLNTKDGQRDEDRFAYPLYVAFLLAPTVGLPFSTVEGIFRWILPACALASFFWWIAMLRWRPDRTIVGSLVILSFFSFPVLESVYIQQPALLVALFLAGMGAALAGGRYKLAGILLALATIKPQLSWLVVVWLMLWALADWSSRKGLVWSFGGAMLVLVGISEALVPGWIEQFATGVVAYQQYTGNFSILALLFTKSAGLLISFVAVVATVMMMWRVRHAAPDSEMFHFILCLVLVATVLIAPTMYPTGQVVLFPAIYLFLKDSGKIWADGYATRLAYVGVFSLIGWQWCGALVTALAALAVPLGLLHRYWLLPVCTIPLIPLGLSVLFGIRARALLGALP